MDEATRLSPRDERVVDEVLETGRYESRAAVVHEALSLLQKRRLAPTLDECAELIEKENLGWTPHALQAALQRGLDSGPARPFDRKAFMERMRREAGVGG